MLHTIYNKAKNTVEIKLPVRFDIEVQREFRSAYESVQTGNTTFFLDFSQTAYINSAALGMMLILREYAEANGGQVVFINISGQVSEVLRVAGFSKLFEFEQGS
jgi:anti-anti-sigma factor